MKRGFNVCILIIVVISVVVSSSVTIFAATHTVYKTTYSAIDGVGDSSYEQINLKLPIISELFKALNDENQINIENNDYPLTISEAKDKILELMKN